MPHPLPDPDPYADESPPTRARVLFIHLALVFMALFFIGLVSAIFYAWVTRPQTNAEVDVKGTSQFEGWSVCVTSAGIPITPEKQFSADDDYTCRFHLLADGRTFAVQLRHDKATTSEPVQQLTPGTLATLYLNADSRPSP